MKLALFFVFAALLAGGAVLAKNSLSKPSLLNDRLKWNKASKTQQDAVIKAVGKRLGSAYKWTETKTYSCGGESQRIATFKHVNSGALLNLIPGGTYTMGSPKIEDGRSSDEGPTPNVTVKAMLIGKTEVSQAQWEAIKKGDKHSYFKGENLPVENVSWNDCQAWLKLAGDGLRLPTEKEWEYACRAGTTRPFCFGSTISPSQVNYDGNYPYGWADKGPYRRRTVAVGSLSANAFGLHEVHGNVWEWCQDPYSSRSRIFRGGSWGDSAKTCRSATRCYNDPDTRSGIIGLRLARSID